MVFWRRQRNVEGMLSSYLDGELGPQELIDVGEHIALRPDCRATLDAFATVSGMVKAATAPRQTPDASAAANRILSRLAMEQQGVVRPGRERPRRHLTPAVIASVGLLVTAGVALAGLRRRGLV